MNEDMLNWNPFGDAEPFGDQTYIADGWKYKDFSKMPADTWSKLLLIIGEGNFHLITHASYVRDGRSFERGQMLISPKGLENYHQSGS